MLKFDVVVVDLLTDCVRCNYTCAFHYIVPACTIQHAAHAIGKTVAVTHVTHGHVRMQCIGTTTTGLILWCAVPVRCVCTYDARAGCVTLLISRVV